MSFWWWCSIGLVVNAEMKIAAGFIDRVAKTEVIDPKTNLIRTVDQKAAGVLAICIAQSPAWPLFFLFEIYAWMKKKK